MSEKSILPAKLIIVAAFIFIIGTFILESMVSGFFERIERMLAEPEQVGFLSYGALFLEVIVYGGVSFYIFRIGYQLLQLKPKGLKETNGVLKVIFFLASILFVIVIIIILFQDSDFIEIGYDTQAEFIVSISAYIIYCLTFGAAAFWGLHALNDESIENLYES